MLTALSESLPGKMESTKTLIVVLIAQRDAYQLKFEAIINLATAILEGNQESDASIIESRHKANGLFINSSNATLSFSIGIVDPLHEVCSRCREPALRRRALDLLARFPRQECVST